MIQNTRGIARNGFCRARQWQRYASSSRPATRQPPKPPQSAKQQHPSRVVRPYKPSATRNPSSSAPPPPPPPPDTILTLWRRSWLPLTGAAILAGFLGFYIFGTAVASLKTCPCEGHHDGSCNDELATPTGRPPALTGENAEQFDKELNLGEWWMGITKLRKKLAQHAKGHVLELAMGTGRNLEYYDWEPLTAIAKGATQPSTRSDRTPGGITSFTGLDISIDMLDVARKRFVKTIPPMSSFAPVVKASNMADHVGGQLSFLNDRLRLINSDAHHPLPPPAVATQGRKYDTIVQTFGLCSVSDPVAVLVNLATAVKPDSGRIILLEHGKGWYGIVNGLLDKNAGKHFQKYGCWWNRDIEALVDEAVRQMPGLEIVKLDRPNVLQMGTLVWIELRVNGTG
ncbi:ubiquinone/menaquinone biosynthesis-related protein [Purpureocillium lilacinum]|uniref:Ubiquinone/menaquinone biosynthesis-related protein n=1 Tax=Purpureocillium lilacinum TaxID=33203 RepID=A0A2U3EPD9_PURLI|nr:ubiquinone/menaquinone biosynthesis-related protein [Purpureocillium lilacinum]